MHLRSFSFRTLSLLPLMVRTTGKMGQISAFVIFGTISEWADKVKRFSRFGAKKSKHDFPWKLQKEPWRIHAKSIEKHTSCFVGQLVAIVDCRSHWATEKLISRFLKPHSVVTTGLWFLKTVGKENCSTHSNIFLSCKPTAARQIWSYLLLEDFEVWKKTWVWPGIAPLLWLIKWS